VLADEPEAAADKVRGGHAFLGGYEIMDKVARREIFLEGPLALHFRARVSALIDSQPSMEEIDEFLGGFRDLMQQPVVMH
jgi:hypothetical protein